MKKCTKTLLLFYSFAFSFFAGSGQESIPKIYESRKEAEAVIKGDKYKSSIGWELKDGDDIKLGKGSMPDKTFAFVTEMPNLLTYNQFTDYNNRKLQHTYNGREAKIASFLVAGNKKSGFYIMAKIKVGQMSRYVIDIENAIEAKEVEIPEQFAKEINTKTPAGNLGTSLTDELKKLKDLFDSGAITKEEYDAAKKKLIGQ